MRAFIGGIVFALVIAGAAWAFGWYPVALVVGGFLGGVGCLWVFVELALADAAGRWSGWR